MEALDSVTRQTAVAVLDACWLQQKLLSSNIANHSTMGYQAKSVDFVDLLDQLDSAVEAKKSGEVSSIDALAMPRIQSDEGEVQLDIQLGNLAVNAARYEAILTSLGRLQSLNRIAVEGGAR